MPCGRPGEGPNPCGERSERRQPQAAEPSERETGFLALFVAPALEEESEDVEGEGAADEESEDEPPDSLDDAAGLAEPEPEPLRVPRPEPLPLRESLRESLL